LGQRDLFYHSDDEYKSFLGKHDLLDNEVAGNGNGREPKKHVRRIHKRAELHEVKDIQRFIGKLKTRGISIEDYFIKREETITGEKPPSKYVLVNNDDEMQLNNVAGIAPGIRTVGAKGVEIKRFKGLGEMNDNELWETTMDPERRTLLRIKAEEAEEAERMFSLLMGDNVELRRNFIEEHALEVKNLDV
jgi:DNA gyrase subunit B